MEKLTVNGKRYVLLAEVFKTCADLYEKCKDDEHPAACRVLDTLVDELINPEFEDCDTKEESKKFIKDIWAEWYSGRYVITTETTDKDGKTKTLFFRRFCWMPGEEDGTPTFTDRAKQAMTWTNHAEAVFQAEILKNRTSAKLEVTPLIRFSSIAKERLLNAIFGDGDGDKVGQS